MKCGLVGDFPKGSEEFFIKLLPEEFEVIVANSLEKFYSMDDLDYIILRNYPLDEKVISQNKKLRFVQKWGAGFEKINIKALGEKGIPVCNTPGANAFVVSEMAVLLMLAVYRNLVVQHNFMTNGIWTKLDYVERSFTLRNKTVGLIGFGAVGKNVSEKVKAFGSKVIYYDLIRIDPEKEKELSVKYCDLESVIRESDIISIHLPLNDGTKNLINKKHFAMMKESAVIINTARGGIINESDLIDAINKNKILGAGLDCIENEPVRPDDPLLNLKSVTLSPHIGGMSIDLYSVIVPLMVDNVVRFHNGKEPQNIINTEYLQERRIICQ